MIILGNRSGDRDFPDRYYALTSILAARGKRTAAKRIVAGAIIALSLPTALFLLNPSSTRWPQGRPVLAIAAASCLAMALLWLRQRWPTRSESILLVIIATSSLALASQAAADPRAGLLVAVSFLFVLGYTAVCHGARLLWFATAAAAVTVGSLALRIAADGVFTAMSGVTPVVLLGVAVVFAGKTLAEVIGAGDAPAEVDLVTGLPTRESFDEQAATLLGARHRGDDRYLVLVLVDIDALGAIADLKGARGRTRARIAAARAVRDSVRRGAVIGHGGESEVLILDTFTTPEPAPLIERLRGAIAATPSGITASIGVVSAPLRPLAEQPPDEVLDTLIARARTAMNEARQAGGNQARYLVA